MAKQAVKKGDKGELVVEIQTLLFKSGDVGEDHPFWGKVRIDYNKTTDEQKLIKWADGDFGKYTEDSVKYFQSRHIGPDKKVLEPTGIVDENTWWAFKNRGTNAQSQ